MASDSKVAEGRVRVVLGTMTFGSEGQTPEAEAVVQLQSFVAAHDAAAKPEIDTARMYGHGATEECLGSIFAAHPELRDQLTVASKVNPFAGYNETLTPDNVRKQCSAILSALRAPSVDILYLHAPDLTTPIEATLAAMNELHAAGAFKELGLSNYPAWEVAHIWHLCREKGWVQPTVYQGMYNGITRAVEMELFPCLRKLGIRFYAYNPLAGGMLTGKHTSMASDDSATGTRFDPSNKMYRDRFWRASVFAALDRIRAACDAAGVTMAEAALRWIVHHSELGAEHGDAVILGASRQAHLDANLAAWRAGPLPHALVAAYDGAWGECRADCPKYFRP